MSRFFFVTALLALTAPGCTLLINANQYVGNGTDAGPPHDANADTGADGGGGGNQPPVLASVGLDSFTPTVGDLVRAIPGSVYDAEGDATTLHYQWYLNGTAITTATSAALTTTANAAGDHIHVEAWATDATGEGPHVSTGDVTLSADVTRWRPLLPADDGNIPRLYWDDVNERAIRVLSDGVWEYTAAAHGLRTIHIPATGTPPPDDEVQISMWDPAHHRALIFSESDPTHVYALDVAHRGSEGWTVIPVSGSAPAFDLLTMTFYDPSTQRVWVVGGYHDSRGAIMAIHSLDVSSPGSETWSTHATTGAPLPGLFGGAPVIDPTTPARAYIFGGVTTPTPGTNVPRDTVLQLDLAAGDVAVSESSIVVAQPTFGAAAAIDPTTGHAVVYGGADGFTETAMALGTADYDLTTGTSTTMPANGGVGFPVLSADARHPGHFFSVGITGTVFSSGSFVRLDELTAGVITPRGDDTRPLHITGASGRLSGGIIHVIGGVDHDVALQAAWQLDTATWQWSSYATMDDAITHLSPAFRYYVVGETSNDFHGPPAIMLSGGRVANGGLADTEAWELGIDGRWIDHTLMTGATALPQREGVMISAGDCSRYAVYGGVDDVGNYAGALSTLDCSGDTSCQWTTTNVEPNGRAFGGIATGRQHMYIFGGRSGSGPLGDLIALGTCSSPPTLDTMTVTGTPPSARLGHSVTVSGGAFSSSLASFLVFGGEDDTSMAPTDVYQFSFSGDTSGQWTMLPITDLVRPMARSRHLAMWDEVGRRLIVIGGSRQLTGGGPLGDVWELRVR